MKIGVTAASGQLGQSVINELKKVPAFKVIGFARTPEKARGLGIEIRKGDYNLKADFEEGLSDIDTLLIITSTAEPEDRVIQHRNIIDAAIGQGVSKIVFSSIQGSPLETDFAPIVESCRSTEEYLKQVFDNWIIGRNGLYIEADFEYVPHYISDGGIYNCAGDSKCNYTCRTELAAAYAKLLTEDTFLNRTLNLSGRGITQPELATEINRRFGSNIGYHYETVKQFHSDRIVDIGDKLGTIISGIYDSIARGYFSEPSDFEEIVGRTHLNLKKMMELYFLETTKIAA